MRTGLRFRRLEANPVLDDDWMEYQIVESEPVHIYSVSGILLRTYPEIFGMDIPEYDQKVIRGQVMEQSRESDVAFSKKDLLFAATYQLSEIRLVGRMQIFSMKPQGSWPAPEILARQYDECMESQDLVFALQRASTTREIAENSWDPEIYLLRLRNNIICKNIARVFNLEYRRDLRFGRYHAPKNRQTLFL